MIDFALQKLLAEKYLNDDGTPNDDLRRKYMELFNSAAGKIVLEDLRHRFFIYAPASGDLDEGSRRVVLHIENCILPIEPAETGAQD